MNKNAQEIIETGEILLASMSECGLCPQECGVDRTSGEKGCCKASDTVRIASCNLHFGEEPPISGTRGSGTLFFSGCSLTCRYCQNYPISQQLVGEDLSIEQLAQKMLSLQQRGAHNINLVTPDHFFGHIAKAIGIARHDGLNIPIVCNSSGYQKLDILKLMEGIIDIYMVDMRYGDNEIARNCSQAKGYKDINRKAIIEMYRQVGNLDCNGDGIAIRGVLIRHLVLPEGLSGSNEIFKFLVKEISTDIHISLMSQYFPAYKAVGDKVLGRKITIAEFDKAIEMFYNAGLKNGYIQESD